MKISIFNKCKPFGNEKSDFTVSCYHKVEESKTLRFHKEYNSTCDYLSEDGYYFFTCENKRYFKFMMKGKNKAKVCCYVVGEQNWATETFLGGHSGCTIVFAKDYPNCHIEVVEGKFQVSKIEKAKKQAPKPKKKESKKNDDIDVPKQDNAKKADKSS